MKKKTEKNNIPESLLIAFDIAANGKVGDIVGFTVGKRHFTLIKDTGYVSDVKLKKIKEK